MVKIKICGLTRLADIEAVNASKPEYIGFVFANSHRKVTYNQAARLKDALSFDIISVGVFVNETPENILALVQSEIVGAIQLHGAENEEYIKQLKAKTDVPIIKAISVQKAGDVQKWGESCVDYLLLDSSAGGTGLAFDWKLIGKTGKPFFLAGGLTIENVPEAIRETAPFAADVSSGVETNRVKDPGKIKEFIRRARNES